MAEANHERFLLQLDSNFGAALAREEEEAADDLAYSLIQGADLVTALRRWRSASMKLADGSVVPIAEVGPDFAAGADGTVICPLRYVTVTRTAGPPLRYGSERLLDRLRRSARDGIDVQVRALDGSVYRGRLVAAGTDHIEITTENGAVLLSDEAVVSVRLCRGG